MQRSRKDRRRVVHKRIRKKLSGTASRPRFCVWKSARNVGAQIINDEDGRTLVSASTREKATRDQLPQAGNIKATHAVGELIAERAKAQGIEKVVFDRGGMLYHGAVKALADAARGKGLDF